MLLFQSILEVVFWVFLVSVFYSYIGYPILVWCLARGIGRTAHHGAPDEEGLPTLSLLIAAHNEEAVIESRIRNALAIDYPDDKLEIVIASDGSSDATAEIVGRFARRGVRLLDYYQRRGKAAVLNAAFAELKGEIVVLSDANTHIDPGAVRELVRRFQDPWVGVVCGRLVLTDPETGRNADGLYWKYETFLKECEGRLEALSGANGGFYAIRKHLFVPIPPSTIVDDLVIPLQARLRTGCGVVYEYHAVAHEETAPDVISEFHRRSRIGAGGFQSIGLLRGLLHPRQGWIAFTFFSHKICRWLCPFFLLGMLASNLLLWELPLYQYCLLGQLGFYLVSMLVGFLPDRLKRLKPLLLTTMFTSMNAALLVGFCRWMTGSQKAVWKRTARLAEA